MLDRQILPGVALRLFLGSLRLEEQPWFPCLNPAAPSCATRPGARSQLAALRVLGDVGLPVLAGTSHPGRQNDGLAV